MGEMGNLNTLKCMLARLQACVIVQTVFLVIFFQIFSSRCLQRNSRNKVYFLKLKHVLRSSQSSF